MNTDNLYENNNKFNTPFTPDQLAPKSSTQDNVNIQVCLLYLPFFLLISYQIIDAIRTTEGAKSSYITYIIQSDVRNLVFH